MNPFDALHQLNLARLSTRRDIANLGIIFRSGTKRGPLRLRSLFKLSASTSRVSPRRPLHRYQVIDVTRGLGRDYLDRSTFGYVAVFNLLPECLFHDGEQELPIAVTAVQTNLNRFLKFASHELDVWDGIFSPRSTIHDHVLRNFSFVSDLDINR